MHANMSALQHAVNLQTKRRTTTDDTLYGLCCRYDKLMEAGRKSVGSKELLTRNSRDRTFFSMITGLHGIHGENFEALKETNCNLCSPVNLAIEPFIDWCRGKRICRDK